MIKISLKNSLRMQFHNSINYTVEMPAATLDERRAYIVTSPGFITVHRANYTGKNKLN